MTRPLRHNGLPYSGMNVLLLWSEAIARGFSNPMWMTFKQALELGGAVRKGETGSMVVFASRFTRTETDAAGEEFDRDIPFLKAYSVFNIAQIDGLPDQFHGHKAEPVRDPVARIDHADRFFANTGAVIRHGGAQPYYAPSLDVIQMPPFETFRDPASYVAVLSHAVARLSGPTQTPTTRLSWCRCRMRTDIYLEPHPPIPENSRANPNAHAVLSRLNSAPQQISLGK